MSSRLLDFLDRDAIQVQIRSEDQRDLIGRLGQPLLDKGYVKEGFVEGVLAREAKMPTGLPLAGDYHAAIPHTDTVHVQRPAVALATLSYPIAFQNMGDPEEVIGVRLVFLLALTEPKSQLEMLQEIAAILQDSETVDRLVNAKNRDELINILETNSPLLN